STDLSETSSSFPCLLSARQAVDCRYPNEPGPSLAPPNPSAHFGLESCLKQSRTCAPALYSATEMVIGSGSATRRGIPHVAVAAAETFDPSKPKTRAKPNFTLSPSLVLVDVATVTSRLCRSSFTSSTLLTPSCALAFAYVVA